MRGEPWLGKGFFSWQSMPIITGAIKAAAVPFTPAFGRFWCFGGIRTRESQKALDALVSYDI
jgi:hypothetical protein